MYGSISRVLTEGQIQALASGRECVRAGTTWNDAAAGTAVRAGGNDGDQRSLGGAGEIHTDTRS